MPFDVVRIFPRPESDVFTTAADAEPLPLLLAAAVVVLLLLLAVDDLLEEDPHAARRRTAAIVQVTSLIRTEHLLFERNL